MSEPERPYTLVAELTYRCPLRCVYCSNPLDYARHGEELDTATWLRVLREAEDLGVVQLNLTGGEPLVRDDLEAIIAEARRLDLYTNLITSGVPLRRERLAGFRALGLDNVQISIQDTEAGASDRIAGRRSFDRKLVVAGWVKELGFPLTLNTVLHRENLDRVEEVVALAERLGADRLELANAQYLGWALPNRGALLPTRAQLARARETAAAARNRLRGKMEVLFVTPDYYTDLPKACMDGWGRRFIVLSPEGLALPCHAAHTLPGLRFDSVRNLSLGEIWRDSAGFRAFRGEDWMPEPCRSCDRRAIDFGGCRCQAYHLTGNAAATDPTCQFSPDHALIEAARQEAQQAMATSFIYRTERESRRWGGVGEERRSLPPTFK
jgi:PqqA peptide cyclase